MLKWMHHFLVNTTGRDFRIYQHIEISKNLTYHYKTIIDDKNVEFENKVFDCNMKFYEVV